MLRRAGPFLAIVILVLGCSAQFDATPFTDAIAEQFDDGEIMNSEQARCVADEMGRKIDWEAVEASGTMASDLFGEIPIGEQLDAAEIEVMIEAIDTCRGAADVVLEIFRMQGAMGEAQIGCFATRMTSTASRDLLTLIMAADEEGFVGSEGEVLLGICGQGVKN